MCATVQESGELPAGLGDEARGDVAVHGLWKKGETCILDICVTDMDAKSYASCASKKVLERAAKKKKDKYLEACLERRRTFAPLAYSVDGMACKEAKTFEKRVASLLATKLGQQYTAKWWISCVPGCLWRLFVRTLFCFVEREVGGR